MFGLGRKRRTHVVPAATAQPRVTSRHTHTHTTHRPARTGGLMSRLRPRRNTPPTHGTYGAPVAVPARTHKPKRTGLNSGFGRKRHAHGSATHHHHSTVPVTTHTTTSTAVPARRTSLGDKVSGAMLKLRGSLSGRPGLKAAGTRRMHGTDGRGTRRYY